MVVYGVFPSAELQGIWQYTEHSCQSNYKVYGSIRSIPVSRFTRYMVVYGAFPSADLQGIW